ncbi:hypothetical protein Pmani_025989 [Petrolisthes manimaculis]|uniref:Uncharacterized protein n=1 Tax=Petrolisthes manimaculis TaxID=1843537 RepID=A0AAE1P635_9EUCA|nr:hypothetical protein Pmani_025989 [Petrolisthes manimaculis]
MRLEEGVREPRKASNNLSPRPPNTCHYQPLNTLAHLVPRAETAIGTRCSRDPDKRFTGVLFVSCGRGIIISGG